MECVYKVRCNLAHGGKLMEHGEANFLAVFADLLEGLLTDQHENLLRLR